MVPAKKATTAKAEYRAVLALAAALMSVRPMPPMPPRALNMPGHRKQTMETMRSWVLGEAYQISLPKMRKPLYFHPSGRWMGPASSGEWASSTTGSPPLSMFFSDMVAWVRKSR